MNENFLTKKREVFFLTLNLIFFKSCTNGPKTILETGGSAAVLAAAAGGILCFLFAAVLAKIYSKCECNDIFELTDKYFSPGTAFCLKIFFLLYLLIFASRSFFRAVQISSLTVFENVPFVFVAFVIFLAVLYAAKCGGKAIIKATELVAPIAVFAAFAAVMTSAGEWDTANIYPLGGYGTKNTLKAVAESFFYYFDFIFILFLNPFGGGKQNLKKTFFSAVICGIVINFLTVAAAGLSFSFEEAKKFEYPVYRLIKTVSLGRVMQRIDAVYFLAVSLCSMVYISFEVFLAGLAFEKTFALSKKNIICSAVSLFVLLLGVLSDNKNHFVFEVFVAAFDVTLCILIFLIPTVCRKRRKNK